METPAKPVLIGRPPDRRTPYVRWSFYLICLCLMLLAGIAAGLVYILLAGDSRPGAQKAGQVSGEMRRDLAGKLLSAGLTGKAIEQYSLYLSESELPPDRRANVAYTIGKLCMDQGRYEDALTWLYQVEMLDPKTNLAPETGSKIVACLEHLGRYAQAQYSLDARTGLNREALEEFKGGEVAAEIGNDQVTVKDLDEAIDAMPAWMREGLQDPAQKEAFLQQYVAEELLYRKAKRLEMDKDPALRRQADRALRQILVQKLLENEIKDKVKLSPEDVELYYQANLDKYQEKEAFKIRMIKADRAQAGEVQAGLNRGADFGELAGKYSVDEPTRDKGGQIAAWVEDGMDPTGMGDPAKLAKALAGHKEGDLCGPVEADQNTFFFKIDSQRAARTPTLDEVRKRVEQDLSRERVEKAYQELVAESLKGSDVKLYPEVFRRAGANTEARPDTGSPMTGQVQRDEPAIPSPSESAPAAR